MPAVAVVPRRRRHLVAPGWQNVGMRRRSQLVAALAAGGIVAVCAVVPGVAMAAASPRADAAPIEDARIPDDMVWPWVSQCIEQVGLGPNYGTTSFTVDPDGVMTAEFGTWDDEGVVIPDEAATAAVGPCISSRKTVPMDDSWHQATLAERVAIYDWTVREQQPCLAVRGIDVRLPPFEEFLRQDSVPWYLLQQYMWTTSGGLVDDFDVLLEARLACPPVPAYLAARGVGW